jgi:penicillin-binding protein 1C
MTGFKAIFDKLSNKSRKFKRRLVLVFIFGILLLWYAFSLPSQLFTTPYSTVVISADGQLLGARVAADGQWRFPESDSLPERFKVCVTEFEDQYFRYHPGVNPLAMLRALRQNIKAGKVESGGSTLTMQVARLSMKHPKRNIRNKLIEIIRATRIECSYSKDEIIQFWASHAPFGGNIVGIEAAAWRYFNRSAFDLSWAESATLAVLPNAPSLMYIGKNADQLIAKRNRLLHKLLEKEYIDSLTYSISLSEHIPRSIYPLPNWAPHITEALVKNQRQSVCITTLDYHLQKQSYRLLQPHANVYTRMGINNIAALILDVKTGKVLAYHGNISGAEKDEFNHRYVDIIQSQRSSGSTLKPLLYAALYDRGDILPSSLVPDIPTYYGSYKPENFHKEFMGLVPAARALASSLNIPAVRLLKRYGVDPFYHDLQLMGFSTINRGAATYGLSLILGGAEVSLWELTGVYASLARVLNNYQFRNYSAEDWHAPYFMGEKPKASLKKVNQLLSASSIALTMNSLLDANRPVNESGWRLFEHNEKIAWKTGTSYGFRDAWSVGVTTKYAVGIWVGNADGEGRAGLTGLSMAAPLMFKLFKHLDDSAWFEMPTASMIELEICEQSGYRARENCPHKKKVWAEKEAQKSKICPWHQVLHLDLSGQYQVNSSCVSPTEMQQKPWFIIPPVYKYYYVQHHPEYKDPPPFRPGCSSPGSRVLDFVIPEHGTQIYLPLDFDGKVSPLVCKAVHNDPHAKLLWHMDNKFLGSTKGIHELDILPKAGQHLFTIMDEDGNSRSIRVEILERE